VGGRSILERLLACLQPIFDDCIIVTRQPRLYADIPARVVADLYDDRSSLTGIHAALVAAKTDFGFVVPCDTPFLQPGVVHTLLGVLTPDLDVVVPRIGDHYEPLCAVYAKRCIPAIEEQLAHGNYRIYDFFNRVNVKTVSTHRIKAVDPRLLSFFNVNTPQAYRTSQRIASSEVASGRSCRRGPS